MSLADDCDLRQTQIVAAHDPGISTPPGRSRAALRLHETHIPSVSEQTRSPSEPGSRETS